MGLFGNKDDNMNKGKKDGSGPNPMHSKLSSKNRFKSKKEIKPMIKQAESEARKSNAFKSMMNTAANQAVSTATANIALNKAEKRAKIANMFGDAGKSLYEAGKMGGLLGKSAMKAAEEQKTDEQEYDRGDYENSYAPSRKYVSDAQRKAVHANKADGGAGHPGKLLGDLDKDGKLSGYEAKRQKAIEKNMDPAQKRMGNMVSAAQQSYVDNNSPARKPILNMGDDTLNDKSLKATRTMRPISKAEKKKSYDDAFASRDMNLYGDLSKKEYITEANRQNESKSSTGKWDIPSSAMVGKDPNKYEGRPGVTIMGDEALSEAGIKSPTSGNPDSDYFVKDSKILGPVDLENNNVIGVNEPEQGMLLRKK